MRRRRDKKVASRNLAIVADCRDGAIKLGTIGQLLKIAADKKRFTFYALRSKNKTILIAKPVVV